MMRVMLVGLYMDGSNSFSPTTDSVVHEEAVGSASNANMRDAIERCVIVRAALKKAGSSYHTYLICVEPLVPGATVAAVPAAEATS
jgi:hypothetical protein